MSKKNKNMDKRVLTWTGSVNSNTGATTASNLAQMFTPKRPMYEPGVELQQLKIWMDIPVELATALREGMRKIDPECLRRNAEIVLDIFQEIIMKHVAALQIKDRTFRRIIRGNPSAESTENVGKLAGVVAKSSLLGQDPWGDKALPALPPSEESATDKDAEPAPVYSEVQAVLKSVQDTTWLYLTTHVKRILHEEILMNIIDLEMAYKADKDGMRTKTPRKRMPWEAYRTTTLEMTAKSSGLYELQVLLALCREVGETAGRWLQRLRIGKSLVEKSNIHLPESLYVKMATRFLTHTEIRTMATCLTRGTDQSSLSMSQARRAIRQLKWDKLRLLVETSVHTGGQKYTTAMHKHLGDTRLFTLEQAAEFLKGHKAPRTGNAAGHKSRSYDRKNPPRCRKCMRAGLTGKVIQHATEDCVDRVRKQNLEKLVKHNSRKRGRERFTSLSGSKVAAKQARRAITKKVPASEEECKDCKSAGRPYRHAPKDCKYAPGGPWHKKSREELRALQRKYYEGKGQSKASRSQANSAVQEKQLRKRTRGEDKEVKVPKDSKRPLWEREYTMIAEQHVGSTADKQEIPEPQRKVLNASSCDRGNSTPGVKTDRTSVTDDVASALRVNQTAEIHVSQPQIVDFSALTASLGPVPPESKGNNVEEEGLKSKESMNSSDNFTKEVTHCANDTMELAENILKAVKEAKKTCDSLNLDPKAEGEYECSDSEEELNKNKCSPDPCPGIPLARETSSQIPAKATNGSSDNPIDLTPEDDSDDEPPELEDPMEQCHMIRGDMGEYEVETTSDEDTEDPQVTITIIPCGPDGLPYEEQYKRYYWYMDQPMWLLMDSLRQDYPVWGDRYRLVLPDGHEVKIQEDPSSLGFHNGQHIRVRLELLHLPSVKAGYHLVKSGERAEEEEAEVHSAAVAATLNQLAANKQAKHKAEVKEAAKTKGVEKVVVLEVWSGKCLRMSVRWGRLDPFRRLLGALATIWVKPEHHLVLLTTAHMLAGEGCIRSCDTPDSLSMPLGGTLLMHHLPHKPDTSPVFHPPLTVAWQLLKTRGVHVWDKTPSGREIGMRGFRGSRTGIFRDFVPIYGKHKQKVTPYINTFLKINKVLQNQYTQIRRSRRKSLYPKRLMGTYKESTGVSSKCGISTKKKNPHKRLVKKFKPTKRPRQSKRKTGTSKRSRNRKINTKSCSDSRSHTPDSYEPESTSETEWTHREISPRQKKWKERKVQNVFKSIKTSSNRSKSAEKPKNRKNSNFPTKVLN